MSTCKDEASEMSPLVALARFGSRLGGDLSPETSAKNG